MKSPISVSVCENYSPLVYEFSFQFSKYVFNEVAREITVSPYDVALLESHDPEALLLHLLRIAREIKARRKEQILPIRVEIIPPPLRPLPSEKQLHEADH